MPAEGKATLRKGESTPRSSGRSGFSLLEILVALMILAVGLTSVFLMFAQGVNTQAKSVNRMEAARLAQSVFAEIQQKLEDTGNLPDVIENKTHESFDDRYKYDVRFSPLQGSEDAVAVMIIVHWEHRGERVEETFTSIVRPD